MGDRVSKNLQPIKMVTDSYSLQPNQELRTRLVEISCLPGQNSSTLTLQIVDPYFVLTVAELALEIERNKTKYLDFNDIKVGSLRCHLDQSKELCSRVRVLEINPDQTTLQVCFIDYGITKNVNLHDCLLLPDSFKMISPQFFKAILFKVEGLAIHQILKKFPGSIFKCKINSKDNLSGCYIVSLHEIIDDVVQELSINDKLLCGDGVTLPKKLSPFLNNIDGDLSRQTQDLMSQATNTTSHVNTGPGLKTKVENCLETSSSEELDLNINIFDLNLSSDEMHDVILTHVVSLSEIYVQFFSEEWLQKIDKVDRLLENVKNKSVDRLLSTGEKIIFIDEKKNFVRGSVICILDQDNGNVYHIRKIDSGEKCVVFQKDIRDCPEDGNILHPTCIKVCQPISSSSMKDIKADQIKKVLPSDLCMKMKFLPAKKPNRQNEQAYPVNFYFPNNKQLLDAMI